MRGSIAALMLAAGVYGTSATAAVVYQVSGTQAKPTVSDGAGWPDYGFGTGEVEFRITTSSDVGIKLFTAHEYNYEDYEVLSDGSLYYLGGNDFPIWHEETTFGRSLVWTLKVRPSRVLPYGGLSQFGGKTREFIYYDDIDWQIDFQPASLGQAFDYQVTISFERGASLPDADWVRNPLPEPSTWAFMIFGFGAVGAVLRRREVQTAR